MGKKKGRRTPWIYYSGLKIVGRGEKISGIHPSLGFCVSFLLEIMGISIIIEWLIYAQKPKRKKMNKELILRHNTIYKKKETEIRATLKIIPLFPFELRE